MSEWAWVIIGFLVTFGVLVAYTVKLVQRTRAIERELGRDR
ncbi:hypothetical protein NQK81_35195 [Amycolatopsis roodepoortensis]|uniref:CcmD family protein n=1 Tax=Amycolatopsis roodepoortensis TaxID=700274 RepID=A0ABR9L4C2_9PSEU|nr:hypothetical protein [Amycolatopsis roodepoortensis]MBE1575375.1 CcmD family protein [Amycolatopsis roodepoortensis]UUV29971.1 hypothetical protein NQK81_35195 [Amycolatopsis roodepoortensis]